MPSILQKRIFGSADESAVDDEVSSVAPSTSRRPSGIAGIGSFARAHRPSFLERWRDRELDETDESVVLDSPSVKPPIPSALQPPPEVYTTPLPALSMTVLSIVSYSVTTVSFKWPKLRYLRPC